MIKIKEKRMQSYVLRARKMVQEGKNKEARRQNKFCFSAAPP